MTWNRCRFETCKAFEIAGAEGVTFDEAPGPAVLPDQGLRLGFETGGYGPGRLRGAALGGTPRMLDIASGLQKFHLERAEKGSIAWLRLATPAQG